jgi:hypothetical protein
MTTGIEYLKPEPKRKGRGPGKKPKLASTSLRIPKHVMEYFNQMPNKQEKMREVLTAYVEAQLNQPNQGE